MQILCLAISPKTVGTRKSISLARNQFQVAAVLASDRARSGTGTYELSSFVDS